MADYITKIRTSTGDKQIDYNALANLPTGTEYLDGVTSNIQEQLNTLSSKTQPSLTDWILIETITSGSGNYTVPDKFNGNNYDLGVYMIGGGGSGGVAGVNMHSTSGDRTASAGGGASGYGMNVVFTNVSPGTVYSYVVGNGGAQKTVTVANGSGQGFAHGDNGGTTSFGEKTAEGGTGGIGAWDLGAYADNNRNGGQNAINIWSGAVSNYYGCIPTSRKGGTYQYYEPSQSTRVGQNQFDPTMVSLACGLNAYAKCTYMSNKASQHSGCSSPKPGYAPTLGEVGTAKADITASITNSVIPTYGNGGGGTATALCNAALTLNGAPGGHGAIFIYARGR